MTPEQLNYKGKISGDFKASFSTTIIGERINVFSILRNIDLKGRKLVTNCVFTEVNPVLNSNSIYLKDQCIENVEIFPTSNQQLPLDKPRKLSLYNVIIINPVINNQQEINGVKHGLIMGFVTADLSPDILKPIDTKIVPIEIDTIPTTFPPPEPIESTGDLIKNKGCLGLIMPTRNLLAPNAPVLPISQNSGGLPNARNGCLSVFRNGCASIFFLLLLLGLLAGLIGHCSGNKSRNDDKNDDKVNQDDIVKDNIIEEKDSTIIIDDKTKKEYRTISLPNVQFYTNKANLLPTSKKDLEKLAVYLLQHLELKATIIGHTDNVGEKQENLILSQQRAEVVMSYLINLGVSGDRISALGKGDQEPRADNDTDEGRLMNRRVEVELTGKNNG
jgi:outer membrane protein OmpA-like peptidoglycan-associated protein